MTRLKESPADLFLARLVANPPYRWALYIVLFLTATASLYLRVGEGRAEQVLPWYTGVLSLYGIGMAWAARDYRCRLVYAAFGLLVAATFTRTFLSSWTRAVGMVEVLACLTMLACLGSLSRDQRLAGRAAVLTFEPSQHSTDQEERNE